MHTQYIFSTLQLGNDNIWNIFSLFLFLFLFFFECYLLFGNFLILLYDTRRLIFQLKWYFFFSIIDNKFKFHSSLYRTIECYIFYNIRLSFESKSTNPITMKAKEKKSNALTLSKHNLIDKSIKPLSIN